MNLPFVEDDIGCKVISEPHDKGVLTTRIGRKIENLSFEDLLVVALLVLLISSEYFFIFTPLGHGMSGGGCWSFDLFLNSVYFSFVTFSTLGYGEILPVGMGRAVAVAQVMCGLIIMTLTIGKIASERQQSLLLLLHTSDCQRRISGFVDSIDEYILELNKASGCVRHIKAEYIKLQLKGLKDLLEAVENYVAFHLYQSKMIDFGNATAVAMLLNKKLELADVLVMVFRSDLADEVVGRRCLALSKKLASFESLVFKFQDHKLLFPDCEMGWRNSFMGIRRKIKLSKKESINLRGKDGDLKARYDSLRTVARTEPSEWIFSQIKNCLLPIPRNQWPPHQHKRIASELGISNKLAQNCIKVLIGRGVC